MVADAAVVSTHISNLAGFNQQPGSGSGSKASCVRSCCTVWYADFRLNKSEKLQKKGGTAWMINYKFSFKNREETHRNRRLLNYRKRSDNCVQQGKHGSGIQQVSIYLYYIIYNINIPYPLVITYYCSHFLLFQIFVLFSTSNCTLRT